MSRKMTQPFPAMGLSVLRVNSSSSKERRKENSHKHSTKRIDRARVTGSKIVLYRKQRPSTPITPRSRSDRSRPSSINRVFRVEFRLEPRPSLPDSSRVDSFTLGGTVFGDGRRGGRCPTDRNTRHGHFSNDRNRITKLSERKSKSQILVVTP